jgi:hypothetical protein
MICTNERLREDMMYQHVIECSPEVDLDVGVER